MMMHTGKRLRTALLSATVFMGLGVAALTPATVVASEAVFVFPSAHNGFPTLNPFKTTINSLAHDLIYDRLVEQDHDQSYHPHLADSWETSADGMQWTFHLRKGVTFHDGEPFNAKVIEWWVPKFAGTDNAYLVEAVDRVEVVDDYTVRLHMKHPDANLLYNLASGFMGVPSPKAYEAAGESYGITTAVGTGPYRLEHFTTGVETALVRNEDYAWGGDLVKNPGKAHIERLLMREIVDESASYLELKTGGVDLVSDVPNALLSQYSKLDGIATKPLPSPGIFYMAINTTSPPFTDLTVRKATALAINQDEIVSRLYRGVGKPAHTFLISALPESKIDPKAEIHHDLRTANQLLEQAGWVRGSDGIRAKDGKRLEVKLWTRGDTEFKRMTEVVQAQLKAVGMQADIGVFDVSSIRDLYKKNEHQLAIRSYEWNNADILDWFLSAERPGYPNVSMWNDPKGEELRLKAMTGSKTMDERIANFKTYHEYVLSQVPVVPIYEPDRTLAYNTSRLIVPDVIRGASFTYATIVDTKVKE